VNPGVPSRRPEPRGEPKPESISHRYSISQAAASRCRERTRQPLETLSHTCPAVNASPKVICRKHLDAYDSLQNQANRGTVPSAKKENRMGRDRSSQAGCLQWPLERYSAADGGYSRSLGRRNSQAALLLSRRLWCARFKKLLENPIVSEFSCIALVTEVPGIAPSPKSTAR